jgi:hypothetical protein
MGIGQYTHINVGIYTCTHKKYTHIAMSKDTLEAHKLNKEI